MIHSRSLTKYIITVYAAVLASASVAQVPDNVRAEIALKQAISEADAGQYGKSLQSLKKYRAIERKISPDVEFLEAQLAYFEGNIEQSYKALSRFFGSSDKSHPQYDNAINLVSQIPYFEIYDELAKTDDRSLKWIEKKAVAKKMIDAGISSDRLAESSSYVGGRAYYWAAMVKWVEAEKTNSSGNESIGIEAAAERLVYQELSCELGYKLACEDIRNEKISSLQPYWGPLSQSITLRGKMQNGVSAGKGRKYKSLREYLEQAVHHGKLGALSKISSLAAICSTRKISIKTNRYFVRSGRQAMIKQRIFPAFSPKENREYSLSELYQSTTIEAQPYEISIDFGSGYSPRYASLKGSVFMTNQGVMVNHGDLDQLKAEIEYFVLGCNEIMPELSSDYVPVVLGEGSAPKSN